VDVWSLGVLLFVLYGAALPFASYDREEMDRMVVEKKVVFEEEGFKSACPQALELISSMLSKDMKLRPTIS